jgi:hypothetical protein
LTTTIHWLFALLGSFGIGLLAFALFIFDGFVDLNGDDLGEPTVDFALAVAG